METKTMVKRVINGKSYNTDTSELVAQSGAHAIYKTRNGAFFMFSKEAGIKPMTQEEVDVAVTSGSFKMTGNTKEILEGCNDDAETQAVVFFRCSKAFKNIIEQIAKKSGLSVNSWLLRVTENAMGSSPSKDFLVNDIENAISYRESKAEQYPHDTRNARSAQGLKELLEYVKGLDEEHPVFLALEIEIKTNTDYQTDFNEQMSSDIARYCFDGKETPEGFIDSLAQNAISQSISNFHRKEEDDEI